MSLTAAQVREARVLLGWTTAVFSRRVPISPAKARGAQDEERFLTLDVLELRTIRLTFERSGIEFRPDDKVRLRGMP